MTRRAWIAGGLALCLAWILLPPPDELAALRHVAILDGGRHKPLDTFAHELAQRVVGGRSLRAVRVQRLDPLEWMVAMMAEPTRWRSQRMIRILSADFAQAVGLPSDTTLVSASELSLALANAPSGAPGGNERERRVADEHERLQEVLRLLEGVFSQSVVRVLPPAPHSGRSDWRSLAALDRDPVPAEDGLRRARDELFSAVRNGPSNRVEAAAVGLAGRLEAATHGAGDADPTRLRVEVWATRVRPFHLAGLFYLMGLACLSIGLATRQPDAGWLGLRASLAGLVVHAVGLAARVVVAGRPPVTNMYESLLWMAWGTPLLALALGLRHRSHLLVACADGVALIALVTAETLPSLDGAIAPLVPVLRDNLWLTTHVLIMTLAYSACGLASALGHFILIAAIARPAAELPRRMSALLHRCLQAGVMLGVTGMLLGGCWASTAWGRFWGWDPKETTTLAAVLVYLAILHAKRAGMLDEFGLALAAILGFLGVVWAWFGVNLVLGLGLHSYGFVLSGQRPVAVFLIGELALAFLVMALWRRSLSVPLETHAGLPDRGGRRE